MTHYEKLAFVIFRTVSLITLFYGLIGIIVSAIGIALSSSNPFNPPKLMYSQLVSYLIFLVFAVLLHAVTKTLANNIGKELEDDKHLESDEK